MTIELYIIILIFKVLAATGYCFCNSFFMVQI